MLKLQDPRTHSWLAVLGAALALMACAAGEDAQARSAAPAARSSSPAQGTSTASAAGGSDPAASDPAASPPSTAAEDTTTIGSSLDGVADQLGAACGSVFNSCMATPGCDDILTCAAQSGCTGLDCYCADASCQSAGPCRAAIAGAPGARVPEPANPSPGPAADAASQVGACLLGLASASGE